MSHRRPNLRNAFTLLEVLITIGIILVLVGIVLVAIKHVGRSANANATKIDLQNLQSMLGELENATPLSTTLTFPNPALFTLPPVPVALSVVPLPAPGEVTSDFYQQSTTTNGYRWLSTATVETQFVMGKLRSITQNRQALQALPGERFLKAEKDGPAYGSASPTATNPIRTADGSPNGTPDPQILVDAWNNPIIFVPGGGLLVATTYAGGTTYGQGVVVTTGATSFYRALKATSAATSDTTAWEQLPSTYDPIVKAPGNRPFWASAGPDGNFQSPDDNIYSFEQ